MTKLWCVENKAQVLGVSYPSDYMHVLQYMPVYVIRDSENYDVLIA